jgi:hypothetical protein
MQMDSPSTPVYQLPPSISTTVWHRLVHSLIEHEEWFGFVWRSDLTFSRRARATRNTLTPLRIEHSRTDRWPGTRLSRGHATVIRYQTSRKALPVLLATDSLYDWVHPDLPEDLFFGSGSNDLALVSVTHEREAWLLDNRYFEELGRSTPLTPEHLTALDRALLEGK